MAIDITARGLALSLLNDEGKLASNLMPGLEITKTTQYAVGGIPTGISLEGKTQEEILTLMLFGVIPPVLISPKLLVSKLPIVGVANRELEISGNIIFDRGKIQPANGTSGFRAGLPSYYIIGDETKTTQETNINFTYLIPSLQKGNNTFSIIVHYDEGEQPLDSMGKEFDSPLPADSLTYTINIVGQDPIYIKVNDNENEVSLKDTYFDYTGNGDGAGYEFIGENNQIFLIPENLSIKGIQQFDTVTQSWQWIGGDPELSLTYFNTNTTTKELDGVSINYIEYISIFDSIGARKLKFYIILPEEG